MSNLLLIIVSVILLMTEGSIASTQAPSITLDSAIKQAELVVVGNFTGQSYQESWEYNDLFDEQGNPVSIIQEVTIHKFRVQELLAGDDAQLEIDIILFGEETMESIVNQKQGQHIVLTLSENAGGDMDSLSRYNLVTAEAIEIETRDQLEQWKNKISHLRVNEPKHPDAYIEEKVLTDLEWEQEYLQITDEEQSPEVLLTPLQDDPSHEPHSHGAFFQQAKTHVLSSSPKKSNSLIEESENKSLLPKGLALDKVMQILLLCSILILVRFGVKRMV